MQANLIVSAADNENIRVKKRSSNNASKLSYVFLVHLFYCILVDQ